MDPDRVNALAFSMGVKRTKIMLPWELPPLSDVFGMQKPLIPPAEWVPEPGGSTQSVSSDRLVTKGHLLGHKSWTSKTTMIPWPVFEEAKLTRVLELWRIVILDSYMHTVLGRKIHELMSCDKPDEEAIKEVIRDALCGKSISTLRARVASLSSFGRWKKSLFLPEEVPIFPISEELAYQYVCELRKEGAPKSRATRFLEALGFCKGMLGADVDEVLNSSRVRGACINRAAALEPKKKNPFSVEQVSLFEYLACSRTDQVGVFCGYLCFIIFGRLRWSDGQYCQEEPWIDAGPEFSYLEARLYHHKTAGRTRVAKRLLPVACAIPGVSREPWAESWLHNRELHGLEAGVGKPTMPAPTAAGGWSSLPLSSSDAIVWLREILAEHGCVAEDASLGTHSAKATVLSWMCKAHAPGDIQRLAGYHVDPNSKSSLEYSRDAQAPVLHFVEGMLLVIYSGLFDPDQTRAGRWKGCRSLEQALDILSKRNQSGDPDEFSEPDESWQQPGYDDPVQQYKLDSIAELGGGENVQPYGQQEPFFDDGSEDESLEDVQSSATEQASADDQEEDDDRLDCNGQAMSGIVNRSGQRGARVFKHRVSGIFHLMAESSEIPDVDGEMSNTKCGKIISRNFFEIEHSISFLPAKCKRCFAN